MIIGLVNYDVARVRRRDPAARTVLAAEHGWTPERVEKYLQEHDDEFIQRKAVSDLPRSLLALGWLRAGSASSYAGDYSRHDDVMKLMRKYLVHPRDQFFPVLRHEREEEIDKIRQWVEIAQRRFLEEVVSGVRERIDSLVEKLESGEIGSSDAVDGTVNRVEAVLKKVKLIRVALATFRLEDRMSSFIDAKLGEIELLRDNFVRDILKREAEKMSESVQ